MTIQEVILQFKLKALESDKGSFWFPVLDKLDIENKDYVKTQQRIISFMREYMNIFFDQFILEFDQTRRLPNTQVAFDEAYFVKISNHLKSACVRATVERIKEDFVGSKETDVTLQQEVSQDIKMKVYPQSINQDVETILEFDCSIKVPDIEKSRQKLLRNDILGEYDLQTVAMSFTNMYKLKNLEQVQAGLEVGQYCARRRENFRSELEKVSRVKLPVYKTTNGEMTQMIKEAYSQSLLSLVFQRLSETLDRHDSPATLSFFKITNTSLIGELSGTLAPDLVRQVDRFISPIKFEMLSSNQASCCFLTLVLDEHVVLHLSTSKEAVVVRVFDAKLDEVNTKMTVREDLARILLSRDCSLAEVHQKLNSPDWVPNFHH